MKKLLLFILLLCAFGLNAQKTHANQGSHARHKLTCLDQSEVKGTWRIGYPKTSRTTMGALLIQMGGTKHYILKPFTYTIQGSTFRIESDDISLTTNPGRCGMSKARLIAFLDNCNSGNYAGQQPARVLFVRESGDNETAIKGQFHSAWRDPWAATVAADSGDIIIVYPSEYTMGGPGSGADHIQTDYTIPGVTLYKNGIQLHLQAGATIRAFILAESTVNPFFYIWDKINAQTYKVTGHGEWYSNQNMMNSIDSTNTLRFFFEADLVHCAPCQSIGWTFRQGIKEVNMKIKKVVFGTLSGEAGRNIPHSYFFFNQPKPLQITDGNFIMHVDDFEFRDSAVITGNSGILRFRSTRNCNFKVTIGNLHGTAKHTGLLIDAAEFAGNGLQNNRVSYTIGNINILDPYIVFDSLYSHFVLTQSSGTLNNGAIDSTETPCLVSIYNQNETSATENNNFTFDIGNITGHTPLGLVLNIRNDFADAKNNIFTFNVGNITMLDSFPAIVLDQRSGGQDNDSEVYINVQGRAQSNGVPIVAIATNIGGKSCIAGTIESTTPEKGCVWLATSQSQIPIFRNCTFINTSAVGIFDADAAEAVNIQSCFANNLNINGNITENISLITRDVLVK